MTCVKYKEWYEKNKSEVNRKRRIKYQDNIIEKRLYHNTKTKEWYARNKEKVKAKYHNTKIKNMEKS